MVIINKMIENLYSYQNTYQQNDKESVSVIKSISKMWVLTKFGP